jgi:hypothetical protein
VGYEAFTWDIEGLISGGPVGSFVSSDGINIDSNAGGPFDYVNYSGGIDYIEFQKTYTLSGSTFDQILSDSNFNILVDLGEGVHGSNSIGVTLTYNGISNVPIPGAVWLLGSCLLGVAGFRRIRK